MAVCQFRCSIAAPLPLTCKDWKSGCSSCDFFAKHGLDPPLSGALLREGRISTSWRLRGILFPFTSWGRHAVLIESPQKQVELRRRKVGVLSVQSQNGVILQAEKEAAQNGQLKTRLDTAALIAPTLAGSKVCSTCHEEKVVGDFKTFKTSPDGLSYQCRACTAEEACRKADQPFPQAFMQGRECTACNRFKPARDFCIYRGKLESRCRSCQRSIERATRVVRTVLDKKRCSFCGQTKPAEDFYPLRKAAGGLLAWCKDCNRINASKKYQERPPKEPRVQSKRCASCKVLKPASEYYAWRKGPDGLQGYCKECSTARCSKNYYLRVDENGTD